MSATTVEEYKARMMDAERNAAKKGMKAHVLITVGVSGILATVNLLFVPEFFWAAFPIVGMSAGTVLHYVLMRTFLEKDLVQKANSI
jgi:hypothetical protein